jgi:hypothetical protein
MKKIRHADLRLDLNCHACGHRFTQRVGWKIKWVYCPVCQSREVHCYGPNQRTADKFPNGKPIPIDQGEEEDAPLLAVK